MLKKKIKEKMCFDEHSCFDDNETCMVDHTILKAFNLESESI